MAKAAWRGRLDAQPIRGVMYCYIDGPRVVIFHTQDFGFAPPEAMAAAIRAFEAAAIGAQR